MYRVLSQFYECYSSHKSAIYILFIFENRAIQSTLCNILEIYFTLMFSIQYFFHFSTFISVSFWKQSSNPHKGGKLINKIISMRIFSGHRYQNVNKVKKCEDRLNARFQNFRIGTKPTRFKDVHEK